MLNSAQECSSDLRAQIQKVSKMKKQPIPEDFELSDDEPAVVNLNEEQNYPVSL